jgi:hypothetical protein
MEEDNNSQNKKRKEYLFSFTTINKYFIFPFLCPIFCFLANLFLSFISKDNGLNNKDFLFSLLIHLSYLGGGLLYFISSLRTKTEQTRNEAITYRERSSSSIRYIFNDASNKNKLYIFIILLIMSILLVLSTISGLYTVDKYVFEERLYYLFFVPILSKIILKKGIFRHQLSSLFISFLGLIIFFIPFFIEIKNNDNSLKNIIIANIFTLIEAIFYSLYLVLTKYLMHSYYLSPFLCILLIGVIGFALNILGFVIFSIYEKNNVFYDAFILLKDMELKYYILLFFIYIIICIYHIFIFLVIYYFSPILSCISDIVNPLFSMIFEALMDNKYNIIHLIVKSFGYILILFAAFIYNEIIILNFCGCNEYTAICIKERGNEELHSIRNSESDSQSEENFIENEEEKVNE